MAATISAVAAVDDLRFDFGENWKRFLESFSEARLSEATESLQRMLEAEQLIGTSFLDLGCGSGLFSLAAQRLGAEPVLSLDLDPISVACAKSLRDRFAPHARWTVDCADATDPSLPDRIGTFDVVYSWGVLYHTGALWEAFEISCRLVAPGGRLYVSIYNDQGGKSALWKRFKRTYNRVPSPLRLPFSILAAVPLETPPLIRSIAHGTLGAYARSWRQTGRGMSRWHDLVDWLGGYPFEVARPAEVVDFCHARGFALTKLKTVGGASGCNEFVFRQLNQGS